jgi:DNA excision repair protein ERCC-2
VKFDAATRVFEVSVRDLAVADGFEGIGAARGEGWNRLGLGAELHVRVLKARRAALPGYQAEVPVQGRFKVGDWTALVSGRLDGCRPIEESGWLVEEFKSAYLPDARRTGGAYESHRRQLLFYCLLWSLLGHESVTASLVYVDLAGGHEEAIDIPFEPDKAERDLRRRLGRLLGLWRAGEKQRKIKAAIALTLPFPHSKPRPGQILLMEAVQATLAKDGILLAEAPTGSGKTAAGLHPAMVHGLETGRQVVFLTSKTLQQRMAVAALTAMNTDGGFRTLQMRSKEKMCANDRVLCHEDFCPYARDYAGKMEKSGLLDRLREEHWHFDPDTVFEQARRERVCPFEVQIELAERVDALVADYNYVFEPGAALGHLDGETPFLLLIDEAHNLPDRARKIFSPELLEEDLKNLVARLREQPGRLFESFLSLADKLAESMQTVANAIPPGAAICEVEPPLEALRSLWSEWEELFVRYLGWKREMNIAAPEDPVVDFHYAFQRIIAVLNLYGPGFTCVVERRATGLRLAVVCLDPARALAPIFRHAAAAILLSATLSPATVFQRVLGLESTRTRTLSLPPPFPRDRRKILILPQVRTTYTARDRYYQPIAKYLADMADAHEGNSLVLFPSYQFLQKVREFLPRPRAKVLIQKPDFTEAERQDVFAQLAKPPPQGLLLLAVLGGMYAEGVDFPGELLSAVFIVSPGLPQVSFERELLRQYYDDTEGNGFEFSYLQPGMTRVVQAAGRLIRSETDHGVIALLCHRFLQDPYASHLPRDWYEKSPAELIARNPAAEIREFFARFQPPTQMNLLMGTPPIPSS